MIAKTMYSTRKVFMSPKKICRLRLPEKGSRCCNDSQHCDCHSDMMNIQGSSSS